MKLCEAYAALELSSDASEDDVKQAYRKLALRVHPDKNPHNTNATEEFQKISAAYKRICDYRCRNQKTSIFRDGHPDVLFDWNSDEDDNDDAMDLSFEDMLFMFQMMFAHNNHLPKHKNTKTRISSSKPPRTGCGKKKTPRVNINSRKKNKQQYPFGFPSSSTFFDPDMMAMFGGNPFDMETELDDMERDFKQMESFLQGPFAYFPIGSDDDGDDDSSTYSDSEEDEQVNPSSKQTSLQPNMPSYDSNQRQQEPESDQLPLTVGAHVRVYGKHTGIVMFMGPVHYAKDNFVGVCLHDPVGKNNGTIKGIEYFVCPPNHGLMVRQQDVQVIA